jgi:hypothetical protein
VERCACSPRKRGAPHPPRSAKPPWQVNRGLGCPQPTLLSTLSSLLTKIDSPLALSFTFTLFVCVFRVRDFVYVNRSAANGYVNDRWAVREPVATQSKRASRRSPLPAHRAKARASDGPRRPRSRDGHSATCQNLFGDRPPCGLRGLCVKPLSRQARQEPLSVCSVVGK